MIFERLVRIYAEPERAALKNRSEPGEKLYKRETIKRRQQEREAKRGMSR